MIKKIIAVFLFLFLLIIGGILFVIYTQSGLRFAVSLAEKFVPELSIGQVNGRLSQLSLTDVSYQMPGVDVKVGRADLSISGTCLLRFEVCVKNLVLEDSRIVVDTALIPQSDEPKEEKPLGEITAPLPIALRAALIKNLDLDVDGNRVQLGEFSTSANWSKRLVTIFPTKIQDLLITLPEMPESEQKQAQAPEKNHDTVQTIGQQLEKLFEKPLLTALPEIKLPIQIDVEELQGNNLTLHQGRDYRLDSLLIQGNARDEGITLEMLSAKGPDGDLAVSGSAQLQDKWQIDIAGSSTMNLPDGKESMTLSLNGAVLEKLTLQVQAKGLVNADLHAETALAKQNIPSTLSLKSPKVQWPLTGASQYQAENIDIQFNGDVRKYQLSVRSSVNGETVPPATISLTGNGGLTNFTLENLLVSVFDGQLQTAGQVKWADAVEWDARLQANKINTVSQLPDFPMVVDGDIKTQGAWKGDDWNVTVSQLMLKGDMKKRPINVSGSLTGDSKGRWDFSQVNALWGNNHVQINGHVSDKIQLTADIKANELGLLSPDLKGTINGKADVNGTLDKPVGKVNLNANAVSFQEWKVGQVQLNADVKSDKEINGTVGLVVKNVKGSGVDIDAVNVNLKGSESSHELTLQLNGKPAEGKVALTGHFDRHALVWKGQLHDSNIASPVGKWAMTQPAKIQFAADSNTLTLGEHCWESRASKICLPKPAVIGSAGNAQVRIEKFNLWAISQFLGDGIALRGVLNGDVSAKWQENQGIPTIEGQIQGKDIVVLQGDGIQPLPIQFDTLSLKTAINNQVVDVDLLAQLQQNGKIVGKIHVTDPQNTKRLSGNVLIDRITMAILQPLLQKNEIAQGVLEGNLSLGGQLTDPLINGNINLSNVKLSASLLPIDVKDADVSIKFLGKESVLNGSIKSGNGALRIDGKANWRVLENWNAELTAKGDEIQVNVPPMVELKFTPDITLSATPKALDLKGSVKIPWARITVESLPESAVDISGDEVMLNTELKPVHPVDAKAIPMEINSNLAIQIGDDVELSAYGLIAKLKGILLVKQNRRGLGLHGEVTIPDGRFHAYGQDLLIKKGELIFSGPVDQPMLNINAIRNPDSIENGVSAGVKVTGLADEPKIEIYSEPAMSQQEALSYLLRGQGLSGEQGGNDNDMMTAILIGLGASQGGKYIGKVGEMFGIRDLSLDTQGVGNSSQVVVSGYILPNLQLKYGIGIFDSLATFTLRYRLLPKLYLEAVSSLDQAVDLLYQFEF